MLKDHLSADITDQCDIFEKPLGNGWLLRKYAHAQVGSPPGKGCYWDEHELIRTQSDLCLKQPGWEWADLDGTRLVWATAGCLWTEQLSDAGLAEPHLSGLGHRLGLRQPGQIEATPDQTCRLSTPAFHAVLPKSGLVQRRRTTQAVRRTMLTALAAIGIPSTSVTAPCQMDCGTFRRLLHRQIMRPFRQIYFTSLETNRVA